MISSFGEERSISSEELRELVSQCLEEKVPNIGSNCVATQRFAAQG